MGVLAGGNACLKYLVFIFNFLFFLIGCGILGIGIWLKVGKQDYLDVTQELSSVSKYVTAGNLMIAVGVIIVIVAFLGCCGAVMENSCMLLVFFILLLIIFILELAVGIFAYVKRGDIEEQLQKDFQDAIQTKYSPTDDKTAVNVAIDKFQKEFECCGYNDFKDWRKSAYHTANKELPKSCCTKAALDANTCPTKDSSLIDVYYKKGCFKEVIDFFKDNIYVVGSACIAFAVIQILGLVFSMLLYRAIKNTGTMA